MFKISLTSQKQQQQQCNSLTESYICYFFQIVENESCFRLQESAVCLPSSVLSNSLFSGAVNIIYYTLNHVLLLESPDVIYTRDRHSSGLSTLRTHHPIESVIVSSTVSPRLKQTQNASVKIVLKNRHVRTMGKVYTYRGTIRPFLSVKYVIFQIARFLLFSQVITLNKPRQLPTV